jgi:hypothetical protein
LAFAAPEAVTQSHAIVKINGSLQKISDFLEIRNSLTKLKAAIELILSFFPGERLSHELGTVLDRVTARNNVG